MTRIVLAAIAALSLTACTTATGTGGSFQPIPGSITYGGQPRTKVTKAPIGSTFGHTFYDSRGRQVDETYRIQPDRSLVIVNRVTRIDYL